MDRETNIVNTFFAPPISFSKNVKILKNTLVADLELNKLIFNQENKENQENLDKPIYEYIFNPTNLLSKIVLEELPNYYTTDVSFLKESQTLLDNIVDTSSAITDFEIDETINAWNEIKSETGFCEKYLYIDWDFAKFINNNKAFLQIMSIYNIASPLVSLCLPILVLIVPFFVIKLKGIDLNMKEYSDIFRDLIQDHAIVKIFTSFNEVDTGQKIYLLASSAFYMFSIYQNILTCIRFYSNMKKIHDYFDKFNKYLMFTIDSMENHLNISSKLTSYSNFNIQVSQNLEVLKKMHNEIKTITPIHTIRFSKILEIGHIMHTFYQIYENTEYNSAFQYSFGFNGYYNLLHGLQNNIKTFKLNKATFITTKKETHKKDKTHKKKPIFNKMYYPKFIDDPNVVTNDCELIKNMIITGPNASGKTTFLKSTLINILLSQQIGFGCFESLKFKPYDNFHCYLNIPDTSGRDSLFQAEARRCKEIIDIINEKNDEMHFCIFDELYSGTNPEEAVTSAKGFMKYIVKNDNVACILSTHYSKLCKQLEKNNRIKNFNMKTIRTNNIFDYTYKLVEGISEIKGSYKVLKDMNYPNEILTTFTTFTTFEKVVPNTPK
jgi:hypothetical protein